MANGKNGRTVFSRIVLPVLSIALIIFGITFTGYHAYSYAQGVFATKSKEMVVSEEMHLKKSWINSSDFKTVEGKAESKSSIKDNSRNNMKESGKSNESSEKAVSIDNDFVFYERAPKTGMEFGELLIPALDVAMPIYEGTSQDVLAKGVGHYSGSVLPGMEDNAVLSGHRGTVFRNLGQVGRGDYLIVRTSAGKFTYQVGKVRIVDAENRTVIVPTPDATLTITTCYPFDFVGDAPKRYVLVADLVRKEVS